MPATKRPTPPNPSHSLSPIWAECTPAGLPGANGSAKATDDISKAVTVTKLQRLHMKAPRAVMFFCRILALAALPKASKKPDFLSETRRIPCCGCENHKKKGRRNRGALC